MSSRAALQYILLSMQSRMLRPGASRASPCLRPRPSQAPGLATAAPGPTRRQGRRARAKTRAFFQELDPGVALSSLGHAAHLHNVDATLRQLLALGDVTVAVAAAGGAAADAAAAVAPPPPDNGWLTPLVDGLDFVLRTIQSALDKAHTPYSYGWSIVGLVAVVKAATFPLTKQQVEGMLSMQALKPKIDAIKAKYGEDKDAVSRETSALYEKAKVNPLAGCLPAIATVPIFIGLYRSLSDVATQGTLDNEGFYWIPSLAGPTSVAARQAGAGTAWLLPLVDGAPPVGWDLALRYLALPIALVIAQYISSAIIAPPVDPNADNAKVQKALYYALPLMVGWFSLNVPSGLSLYYFSNTVMTGAMQVYLRKLGGAKSAEFDLGPLELGKARRTGVTASSASSSVEEATTDADAEPAGDGSNAASENGTSLDFAAAAQGQHAGAAAVLESAPTPINRRCKRKRRELLEV